MEQVLVDFSSVDQSITMSQTSLEHPPSPTPGSNRAAPFELTPNFVSQDIDVDWDVTEQLLVESEKNESSPDQRDALPLEPGYATSVAGKSSII